MVVMAVNRSMERSLVVEPASDEAAEVDAEDTVAPLRHTRRGTFLFNYDTPESTQSSRPSRLRPTGEAEKRSANRHGEMHYRAFQGLEGVQLTHLGVKGNVEADRLDKVGFPDM